jgi:hypothetical protein
MPHKPWKGQPRKVKYESWWRGHYLIPDYQEALLDYQEGLIRTISFLAVFVRNVRDAQNSHKKGSRHK